MLLGAVYKQKEINPVDYVYGALNLVIEPLDKDSGEYEVLRQYIITTQNGANPNSEIANIFKI
jgi:hypothetical protein